MKGLPTLRKPKPMKGLAGLGKKRKQPKLDPPALNADEINIASDREDYITRLVGDRRLAQRVMVLQQRYTRATIPEAVAYLWLEDAGVDFGFQVPVAGGRTKYGGQVIDFVINNGGNGLAWYIQGDYWHAGIGAGAQEKSTANALATLGHTAGGLRLEQVVQIWESKIYSFYPHVFEMAIAGIEVGK